MKLEFSRQIFENSNFKVYENPSVGAALFRADRQTDRQTDGTKLVVAFRCFAKTPKF